MAFGNGFTGLLMASIVTLSSGAAFIICFRELFREILEIGTREISEHADSVATSTGASAGDATSASRVWENRTSYLLMVGFLGLVGIAGFVAGLTHFASKNLGT